MVEYTVFDEKKVERRHKQANGVYKGGNIYYDPENMAKAMGREMDVSPKDAVEICRYIKGFYIKDALDALQNVMDKKLAIPYKRHLKSVSHRKGGVGPGRYPFKAAKGIYKLLKELEQNAEYEGFDPDDMVIVHSVAHRGPRTEGYMQRSHGRSTPWVKRTSHIELIAEVVEE